MPKSLTKYVGFAGIIAGGLLAAFFAHHFCHSLSAWLVFTIAIATSVGGYDLYRRHEFAAILADAIAEERKYTAEAKAELAALKTDFHAQVAAEIAKAKADLAKL